MGIKYFKREPKHKYRIYLKSHKFNDSDSREFYKFLMTNKDNKTLTPCESLERGFRLSLTHGYGKFVYPGYYIDYDEESIIDKTNKVW